MDNNGYVNAKQATLRCCGYTQGLLLVRCGGWRRSAGAARLRPPASSSTLAPAQHSSQHPQPAMDRDSLTLQINNMRFQAKMERWPLSKSIEAWVCILYYYFRYTTVRMAGSCWAAAVRPAPSLRLTCARTVQYWFCRYLYLCGQWLCSNINGCSQKSWYIQSYIYRLRMVWLKICPDIAGWRLSSKKMKRGIIWSILLIRK